ncbi:MFS transporter [Arthrobacter sp. 4R501]|uniref:MFS transporter n=1 Tax=Arthrobacter sp. 4R501 TaxID=2058886 RepID=UPI0015E3BF30|nr:MFS transporter [Arthrobacter sp. 4R501]
MKDAQLRKSAVTSVSLTARALRLVPSAGQLVKEYGLTPTEAAFALSATGISGAAFVPVLSRLGDISGIRRLLLISLVFVGVENILCAVAQGPALLLTGRALVGINAALPLLYALPRLQSHDKGAVDRSSGLMTAAIGGGIAAPFLFGGVVIAAGGSVRKVLEIMTAFSLLLLVLAWLFVQDSDVRTKVTVDYFCAILMGAGLAASLWHSAKAAAGAGALL